MLAEESIPSKPLYVVIIEENGQILCDSRSECSCGRAEVAHHCSESYLRGMNGTMVVLHQLEATGCRVNNEEQCNQIKKDSDCIAIRSVDGMHFNVKSAKWSGARN